MKNDDFLTQSRIAKLAGVHVETLRFYERQGLLPESTILGPKRRIFPKSTLSRILFIKQCQRFGFSLREAGELIKLQDAKRNQCNRVLPFMEKKIIELRKKIHFIKKNIDQFEKMEIECPFKNTEAPCPFLQTDVGFPP